ncbi:MAG: aconitate hydratase [Armatimonadota bacterium]|nr:aconitate hydratase [Armatimonadota bacterium]MDR7450680.1 aconitate hydratase [Armatimonadota bacterium]MDR7466036.1 aconitate hydratase [Armatimonadota bacterium]MDR7493927.1 aconitate hydratase [Armatimonadota bacterium]MDR7504032.1 aconitate hydratase [Armatimonadota bacterium]
MDENLTGKILRAHLVEGRMVPGEEIGIRIDQVLAQDLTATQAFLHFEAMGITRVRCRLAACYADHNVLHIRPENMEDHLYLQTAARKYGVWFAKPASGIGHQIHLEHFAVPGETVLGADSHTPHCGGVGMIAIGAGGMDVAIAMGGGPYHLDMPHVVRVHLTGQLRPWSTAKDVVLELLRRLTVRGGRGKIFEFTGPGVRTLNAQQRVTITNMSYELGATTSIFPSDDLTRDYFRRLGRERDWRELEPDPDADYDDDLEVDLSTIEPLVARPSLPDNVVPVREVAGTKVQQVMVGSCTNGSYTDLRAVAHIMRGRRVHPEVYFFIHPSSRADLERLAEEGGVADLLAAGVNVAEPTCGACIGFGHVPAPGTKSLRAINRNFKGRSGLPDDEVYLASSETAAATAIMGAITDPRDLARELGISPPLAELPAQIRQDDPNLIPPADEAEAAEIEIHRGESIRPAPVKPLLEAAVSGPVLIKVGDDISTDHIMPAGAEIVAHRSNVPKLAEYVFHRMDPTFAARARAASGGFIVGGENYGQGSSREHAALAPMFLGIKGVIAKSFSRIHRANLINWGLLPMAFADPRAYDDVEQGDELEISEVRAHLEGAATRLTVRNTSRGTSFEVAVDLNPRERAYILAGGRLAYVKAHPLR